MKTKPFLSILPLVFLLACSIEDPDTGPPEPETKDPVPKEEPPVTEEEEKEPEPEETEDTEPPTVPTELRISENSFESFNLTWSASTDNDRVAHYLVYLEGTQVAEVTDTSTAFSGLTPGQKYALKVTAVDPSGNSSDASEPVEETTLVDTEPPSVPVQAPASGSAEAGVILTWTASSDNAGIKEYDIYLNGEFLATTIETEYFIEGLEKATTYTFTVSARDIYGNNSPKSEEVKFTTEAANPPDPSTPDPEVNGVFFSEYIEGSSNNKALEIANLSGSEIDLSAYSLKKIANENDEWKDEKKLEGKLSPGGVFVIAHSKADPQILQQADLLMGGGIIAFNGNDPIGLFRDGELVDIIGALGGADFAKDVTLRRKTTPISPTISYNPEDWEVLGIDSFDGLGEL